MDVMNLPCIVHLKNGKGATIALAEAGDGVGLLQFFRAMPEEDRLVLKEDVTTSDWLDRFLSKLSSGEAISVVGKVGGEIRGEATLHRTFHGWSRHVGEIRLNVDRAARGQGLGLELARQPVKLDIHGKRLDLLIYANDVSHIWSAMESLLGDFRPDRATR